MLKTLFIILALSVRAFGEHEVNTARPEGLSLAAEIDAALQKTWQEAGVTPGPFVSDAELIRRSYLDFAGRTPSLAELEKYQGLSGKPLQKEVCKSIMEGKYFSDIATYWRDLLSSSLGYENLGQKDAKELISEILNYKATPFFVTEETAEAEINSLGKLTGSHIGCVKCHDDNLGGPFEQSDYNELLLYRYGVQAARFEGIKDIEIQAGLFGEKLEREAIRRKLSNLPQVGAVLANFIWANIFGKPLNGPTAMVTKLAFDEEKNPVLERKHQVLWKLLADKLVEDKFDLKNVLNAICISNVYRVGSDSTQKDENEGLFHYRVPRHMNSFQRLLSKVTVDTKGASQGSELGYLQLEEAQEAYNPEDPAGDTVTSQTFYDQMRSPRRANHYRPFYSFISETNEPEASSVVVRKVFQRMLSQSPEPELVAALSQNLRKKSKEERILELAEFFVSDLEVLFKGRLYPIPPELRTDLQKRVETHLLAIGWETLSKWAKEPTPISLWENLQSSVPADFAESVSGEGGTILSPSYGTGRQILLIEYDYQELVDAITTRFEYWSIP